jgi:DNA modification methylase
MGKLILGPGDCKETVQSVEDFEDLLEFYGAKVRTEDGKPLEVLSCGEKICVYVKRYENLLEIKRILRENGFNSKNCIIYVKRN